MRDTKVQVALDNFYLFYVTSISRAFCCYSENYRQEERQDNESLGHTYHKGSHDNIILFEDKNKGTRKA